MSADGAGATLSIFVTGATGVIGRHALPRMVALGHRVTAIGRSAEKRAWLGSVGVRPVGLDLFDPDGVRRTLAEAETRVVVNLATHIPSSPLAMMLPWAWRENSRIRREGSATLVDAALDTGVRRFVQESFAPVYEDGGREWIEESWPVRPAPYSRSVLDAERAAARFSEAGGIGVVLRFAGFYGADPFLRTMVRTVERGWSPLPGPPDGFWSAVAHEDAATAVVASLDVPAGTYNVCDDEPLTRLSFGDALARAVGARTPRPMPRWVGVLGGATMEMLSRSHRMSNRKLRSASGWTPRWRSASEGLPAAVEALRG